MWFSLFGVLLVLAITFFQGLQGLFSALINCILTVLAAALAFGLYEDVFHSFLIDSQPDYGQAMAFIGIFVVAGVVLRVIFDLLITENLHLPVYVDRAGGGLFGLVTGLVVVGMLQIGGQMLSFGPTIMGFARYKVVQSVENKSSDELTPLDFKEARLVPQTTLLQPDGFTVGLMSLLSANSLHGRTNLTDVYPDFLGRLHWPRSHIYGKIRGTLKSEDIKVIGCWDLKPNEFYAIAPEKDANSTKKLKLTAAPPPESGTTRRAVRVAVSTPDEGNNYRFVPQQVRLVGRERKTGPMKEYYLIGLDEEAAGGKLVEVYPARPLDITPKGEKQFDFVFQIPNDFQVVFVEYKGARAELPPPLDVTKKRLPPLGPKPKTPAPKPKDAEPKAAEPKPSPTPSPAPAPDGGSSDASSGSSQTDAPRPQGRVQGVRAQDGSILGEQLPFQLTDYETQGDVEFSKGLIRGGTGRLFAEFQGGSPKAGSKQPLTGFEVPEGKRLLQLHVNELDPKSMLGNVLRFVVQGVQKYNVHDATNNNYPAVGVYAVANVGGRQILELVYFDETARMSNYPPKLERIKHDNLKEDYELFFLFHVPPKTQIIRFSTGRQSEDLRPFKLISPD